MSRGHILSICDARTINRKSASLIWFKWNTYQNFNDLRIIMLRWISFDRACNCSSLASRYPVQIFFYQTRVNCLKTEEIIMLQVESPLYVYSPYLLYFFVHKRIFLDIELMVFTIRLDFELSRNKNYFLRSNNETNVIWSEYLTSARKIASESATSDSEK